MPLTFSNFLASVMLRCGRRAPHRGRGTVDRAGREGVEDVRLGPGSRRESHPAKLGAAFAGTLSTRLVLAPPADPEFTGTTERKKAGSSTPFLPGRQFVSSAESSTTDCPARTRGQSVPLGGRRVDVLGRDRRQRRGLPPHPPARGGEALQARARLGRDYSDGNDHSVDPSVILHLLDVTATLTRVIAMCALRRTPALKRGSAGQK